MPFHGSYHLLPRLNDTHVEEQKHASFEIPGPACFQVKHPYPYRGGRRGGTKPTCRIPFFLAWKPWDSDGKFLGGEEMVACEFPAGPAKN